MAEAIDVLAERGPALDRPLVDRLKGSAFHNMKVMLVVRVAVALGLAWIGSVLAVGCYIALRWQISPWPGETGSMLGVAFYGMLALLLLAGPMVGWWFRLPRARWWGIVVTASLAVATYAALGFSFRA